MPLEGSHEGDVGMKIEEGLVCKYDVKDGAIKSGDEIFEGGVQFFMRDATDGDRALAERLTRKNMNLLPHWQMHHFALLDGDQATDEEFQTAMMQLG